MNETRDFSQMFPLTYESLDQQAWGLGFALVGGALRRMRLTPLKLGWHPILFPEEVSRLKFLGWVHFFSAVQLT